MEERLQDMSGKIKIYNVYEFRKQEMTEKGMG